MNRIAYSREKEAQQAEPEFKSAARVLGQKSRAVEKN
jgi:hypothetical protein